MLIRPPRRYPPPPPPPRLRAPAASRSSGRDLEGDLDASQRLADRAARFRGLRRLAERVGVEAVDITGHAEGDPREPEPAGGIGAEADGGGDVERPRGTTSARPPTPTTTWRSRLSGRRQSAPRGSLPRRRRRRPAWGTTPRTCRPPSWSCRPCRSLVRAFRSRRCELYVLAWRRRYPRSTRHRLEAIAQRLLGELVDARFGPFVDEATAGVIGEHIERPIASVGHEHGRRGRPRRAARPSVVGSPDDRRLRRPRHLHEHRQRRVGALGHQQSRGVCWCSAHGSATSPWR